MKIKKSNNQLLDVKIIGYTPNIGVNYKLVQLSSGNFVSIDRGILSDRYETTLVFRGKLPAINEIVDTLNELRSNNKKVYLSELDEKFFGEHLDYSIDLNCVVSNMGQVSSPVLNVYTIEVSFLLTNPIYDLPDFNEFTFPQSLKCLQSNWSGTSEWNTTVNETYYSSNYFVNRETDTSTFIGSYVMKNSDVKDMYDWLVSHRGSPFTCLDGSFGITGMFGPQVTDASHSVIIQDMSYSILSSGYKLLTISLIKVG